MKAINEKIFSKEFTGWGKFEICHFNLQEHSSIIHHWVNKSYAEYWQMQNTTVQEVTDAYESLIKDQNNSIYMGYFNGQPAFLLECYNPIESQLTQFYTAKDSDKGMHILTAPCEEKIPSFTWNIFQTIIEFIFSDHTIHRIIVEPDVRNEKIHKLNFKAGFVYEKKIKLPNKEAYLGFCNREDFFNSLEKTIHTPHQSMNQNLIISPQKTIEHLTPENWHKANSFIVQKAISEFSHEMLITPELETIIQDWHHYKLCPKTNPENIVYRFKAKKLALDHWMIDKESIKKTKNEKELSLDAVHFMIEFKEDLGFSETVLPVYIEEIISTLNGRAQIYGRENNAQILADADYQSIEGSMTGHPTFLANNGRIGFDADDYYKYAPESQNEIKLIWIALKKEQCVMATIQSMSYEELLEHEISASEKLRFDRTLLELELQAENFYYIPIHPWQWYNKMNTIFAIEIGRQNIILLGETQDYYKAQQSIRTFYNISNPQKFYVKTALSILNMGFMRGLSPYYMNSTPAVNEWLEELLIDDPYLKQRNFILLKEIAAIGFRSEYYEKALGNNNTPYTKMLATLWRESPNQYIGENQKIMTMASLLHVDNQDNALVSQLIQKSGLSIKNWLSKYFDVYLMPMIHCFYQYDLVFMPHGENLILVMEDHVPVKIFMKDISEEIAVFNQDIELPENVSRVRLEMPDYIQLLSIYTDVFDCFFRYLSAVLYEHSGFSDEDFWQLVAEKIFSYQEEMPHLKEKFVRFDIFEEKFKRSCLNRIQIKNNKHMLNLADPAGSLQFFGDLENPIHKYKK
ncbi:GNAT family N-acetyltransferase [Chryseobacterium fistulae]|uniref:Aerobactin synthase n=1 Tax=Chryseobacterium fistulae TaxID=2675058 RepID=A0A6N4XSG3_9FLAO|nr:GNAT family N-acetyltransferase [Chryseobacterium fistulae]CAA7392394.1 Aerobactin synthase [Chryseobacterium fistulae]